jgi:hypothetical protein
MNALLRDLLAELNGARAMTPEAKSIRNGATEGLTMLRDATEVLLQIHAADPARALGVAVPYLQLCGLVMGAALFARAASIAEAALQKGDEADFYRAKLQTARFYAEQLLPMAPGLARVVKAGAGSVAEAETDLI